MEIHRIMVDICIPNSAVKLSADGGRTGGQMTEEQPCRPMPERGKRNLEIANGMVRQQMKTPLTDGKHIHRKQTVNGGRH